MKKDEKKNGGMKKDEKKKDGMEKDEKKNGGMKKDEKKKDEKEKDGMGNGGKEKDGNGRAEWEEVMKWGKERNCGEGTGIVYNKKKTMHKLQYLTAGKPVEETGKALIMIHGRGGSAEDILSLADALPVGDFTLFAPKAVSNSWYPYSFLMPPERNEPWLSSAVEVVGKLVEEIGLPKDKIWFTGFSQGACLTLEYIARNAGKYGGVSAFTGGLIGDRIYREKYKGDFGGTPVFIGTSDPDPHVPVQRVLETEKVLKELGAEVNVKVYPGMGHTITQQEIRDAVAAGVWG